MGRRIAITAGALPLALLLCGFTPFTQVNNVCPTCPAAKTDVVIMTTGYKVACNVLAETTDYYVLERHGELRAARKNVVTKIEWKTGAPPASLRVGDQILTRNNVVYHGSIVEEQPGRYFIILLGENRHVIWMSQIESVFRNGQRYSFSASPPSGR